MTFPKIRTAAASTLAAAGLLITLAACSTPASTRPNPTATSSEAASSTSASAAAESGPCDGVKVIVDSGAIKQAAATESVCVPVSEATTAAKVLEQADVKTEGTKQYPAELVCRVNGVPAADFDITHKGGTYREECATMPAAFAYWAIWIKPASGDWTYAQEGLATQQVKPGESLELLYTVDGAPATPAA
ncbi:MULTISPECIES: hypothetical protein [Paenarthrobacter]|uniref:Lipoprotein n=1 Tax=Paenarthrobacter ureafaciens TaxID=37931 RepID=A0AAX3EK39_PAEUR|nr:MULTISPECIES: hypothetical protein [Paenarthrobacter]NKR13637.1 hypothetical protein [Arthrobacter sp. M5]NKR17662.1 hypothetical protein [Arthrobacter sp. M6]OEH58135.1 hypothetical protein A5N13_21655 [Arthrobacter sp. D4]OEH58257.1 hypothetical protein A5N17_21835 [Arthrobacter sp. D2]MDO5866682.1 hypothetical protein [Paenarthrobacter sp. SD-2]